MIKQALLTLTAVLAATWLGTPHVPSTKAVLEREPSVRSTVMHAPAAEPKETTIMVYMTGSDLESSSAAATKDMQEMAESGIDLTGTNVVVYTGGSPKWHSDVPENANTALVLQKDGFVQAETFSQQSMGAPENLTRFLDYAYKQFPADVYHLILWDHGNGPVIGYCLDKLYENDSLTLTEMKQALDASPFSEQNKLGFIGFDACLMASAELVSTLGEYADYLIASQETEPNFGWNYAFLKDCGKLSTKELACSAVDAYISYCEDYYAKKQFFRSDVTMSVVDLSLREELKDDLNNLFRKIMPDAVGQFNRIAVSRVHTRSFGRASTGSEYDLVDLRCLVEELEPFYPEEAQKLYGLLDRLVVYAASNTEESCGVSLYYPFYNKEYYNSEWRDVYQDMNAFPNYMNFLYRFEQTWLAADLQDLFDSSMNVEQGHDEGSYSLPLSPEQLDAIAEGRYYILRRLGEGIYTPVYIGANVQKTDEGMVAYFDGNILYYTDETGAKGIPIIRLIEQVGTHAEYRLLGCHVATAPMGLGTMQACDVLLSVDQTDNSVTIKGIYESDNQNTGKKKEIDLSEWKLMTFMELSPRFLSRTESGRIMPLLDWPSNETYSGYEIPLANNLDFILEPLYDDGYEYCIMFELTDVQGNKVCSEPFELKRSDAPATQSTQVSVSTLTWDENNTAVLQKDGVTLEFRYGFDLTLQEPTCWIVAANTNAFPVNITLNAVSVGRMIDRKNSVHMLDLAPGQTCASEFSPLRKLWEQSGSSEPVRFLISMENAENYGVLCSALPIELDSAAALTPELLKLPLFGAEAEEQVLYSENGLEIHLVGLGLFRSADILDPESDWTTLTAYYRIDNHTDTKHSVQFKNLVLNGSSISDAFSFANTITLAPQKSCFIERQLRRSSMTESGVFNVFLEAGAAPEITSVSAEIVIDGQAFCLPIVLSAFGKGA